MSSSPQPCRVGCLPISGSDEEVEAERLLTLGCRALNLMHLRHLRDTCCSHFTDVVTEAQAGKGGAWAASWQVLSTLQDKGGSIKLGGVCLLLRSGPNPPSVPLGCGRRCGHLCPAQSGSSSPSMRATEETSRWVPRPLWQVYPTCAQAPARPQFPHLQSAGSKTCSAESEPFISASKPHCQRGLQGPGGKDQSLLFSHAVFLR